ncbi:hypothetical protein [Saccharothrix sp. HUAS TT1]|uniref:hypothetical protein n=1 Tax=unclassified Saccharothrix TaxID=2593673 RepID=UPI00345BCB69
MAFILAGAAGVLIISGLIYVVVNFWWALLLLLVGGAGWLYRYHPGVRAKRELRAAVSRGQEQRERIRNATWRAKADMDRIARDWKRRS